MKLSDWIIYVVVAKMTLKQTYCIVQMELWVSEVKEKYLMTMNLFTACEREAGVQLPLVPSVFLACWCVVRKLVSWLRRPLAGERKRQRA
jgi:hypothetical protein